MFFSKRVKFFIGLFLIFFQLNFSFAEFLISKQEEVILNQALSPNSQLTSLDSIFSIALRMANSGMSEEEIWSFLKASQANIVGVSINIDTLNIEIIDNKDNTKLYEFKIDRSISQPNKIYESVQKSLNKPIEIIEGAKEFIQTSISIVKILMNSWKAFFIASIVSFMIIFASPYNTALAATKSAPVISAEQQVKDLAAELKKEELKEVSISLERKKIDEIFYKYIFDAFKEASYALYYKIDPSSRQYGNTSAFKAAARNYAEEKAQENIDNVIKGLNWTMFEEIKKFPMIAKVAKNYNIDPTVLLAVRIFETWDLSYGEEYTDFFKATLLDSTSVGAYQIRIDKMNQYLKSAYGDLAFIKDNHAFFKKYPTYEKFIEVNGSIKNVLEADGETAVELAIIFLKKQTEALKEVFPDIFGVDFSLKDSSIKDNSLKNQFNIFFLAYTYDLIGNHKGETMSEIFQKIKTNKPDLYLWMKIESQMLKILQDILKLYHNESYSEISEIRGFNLNDFIYGASKSSLPSEMNQNGFIKYFFWGAFLVAVGGIFYKIRKMLTGNKMINSKNRNRKTVDKGRVIYPINRAVSKVVENSFQINTNIRSNPKQFSVMYGNKIFPFKISSIEKARNFESFLRIFKNTMQSIISEINKQNSKILPKLSELYIPVSFLKNKYEDRSNIIYELYNMQLLYLKNGVLNFEHKPGMINLAFLDYVTGTLNKNLNWTLIGQREMNLLHQAA